MANKKKKKNHRKPVRKSSALRRVLTQALPQSITIAESDGELKIDLACGQRPREGFHGVDIVGGEGITKLNVLEYPWPWADSSVSILHCSHFIEHVPAIEVGPDGSAVPYGTGQDALFRFFDEAWRVLKPDGLMEIIWPSSRSDRAFWDPTHRRFLPQQFTMYLNQAWRVGQSLDHYNVHCNFIDSSNFTIDPAMQTLSDDARTRHFNNYWNTIIDFYSKLRAIKPGSAQPDTVAPAGNFVLAK